MKITVHGTSLHVKEQGSGFPVILLHGFPLDHRMWDKQSDSLAERYRVITPDMRGMGKSEVSKDVISLQQYADDILALMDELQIKKAALGGFSMGGYVAFALMRKAPERFAALILANTRPEADAPEGRKNRMNMAASLYEKGAAAASDSMLPKLITEQSKESMPALVEELSQIMTSMQPEGLVHASLAMAFRSDSVDMLPSIAIPTLVITGEQDPITPPDVMKKMADSIPQAEYHVIQHASHLTPMEQPNAFNKLLRDFLASVHL